MRPTDRTDVPISDGQRDWIDSANYIQLLERWRFNTSDDTIFHGESGKYYAEVMDQRKREIGQRAAVEASKLVGWQQ